ncbi:golgin subfamily A member 6-like protein 22 isoform X3 [Periplaneta americana]|uniref:golgin subfamily A member 6-like protein 22 isoform X3 n=1 Tax=Periplaneta americana TaxID=6978 RepID=UPI0037E8CDD9
MTNIVSIAELKDLVKTLEEEVLPLVEEVKNLNEVQDGISSIDLEAGKEDKGAEKNKESEGMGVVNTKEKELLGKQEELIKLHKQLEKLQDEELKQLRLEHEEEKRFLLQEEEFKDRKIERLENDLIEYEYRLQQKICIEEDVENLREELETKHKKEQTELTQDIDAERRMNRREAEKYENQLANLRQELEAEREMRRQLEDSKEEELGLLRTEVEAKDKELKDMAEDLLAERQRDANKEIKQLTQEHEEEKKSWLQEEAFKDRKMERLENDLIECEYRLQCKICIEEDLANLRDELEEKWRQQEASYQDQLGKLRQELEAEREMRCQLEESKEEALRALREELQAKREELKKTADELQAERQKTAELRAAAEVGANLEHKDRQGRTELHRAAKRGDTHRVQLLLDAGSPVNAVDHYGRTPLWLAAEQGRQDACRALLAAGARLDVKGGRTGCTALHVAALNGRRAVCELLLAAGARPNEPDDTNQWTALHRAAYNGHAPVVQLLLQHCAERGARDRQERTALDLARQGGYTEVAAMLQD